MPGSTWYSPGGGRRGFRVRRGAVNYDIQRMRPEVLPGIANKESAAAPDGDGVGTAEQPVEIDAGRTNLLAGECLPTPIIDMLQIELSEVFLLFRRISTDQAALGCIARGAEEGASGAVVRACLQTASALQAPGSLVGDLQIFLFDFSVFPAPLLQCFQVVKKNRPVGQQILHHREFTQRRKKD